MSARKSYDRRSMAGREHAMAMLRFLDAERMTRGLSVEQVCARSGVSRTMYYEWIAGRHEPKLSSVMMLQRALRVAIALKGKTGMAVIRANEAEKMNAEKEGSGDAP